MPRETVMMVDAWHTSYAPASISRRLAAFAVDYVFIALYLVVLTLLAVSLPSATEFFRSPASGQAAGFLVLTLPVLLYFGLWEGSSYAATPGKRAVGIAVRRSNGTRLSRLRALARNALKLVPWELAHTCLWRIPGWPQPNGELPLWAIAGFVTVWALILSNLLLAWRSRTGQAGYDWIADTVVVRTAGPKAR
jgi:uncharacterized RDD family membrane protein YckC